jgi:hypothetical protein
MDAIQSKRDKQALQHKHNYMHTQIKYPKGAQSDIWLVCSGYQGPQGGKKRTRLTIGGDHIEYPGDKSTRTTGLTTAKILINSVISTFGAKFLVIDINNFYLNTPLGRFEYMVINLSSLSHETIDKYDLIELVQDGKVYV